MFQVGIIGLGAMGRNLSLGLVERGLEVIAFSYVQIERDSLATEDNSPILVSSLEELLVRIKPPRHLLLMVTAGDPVDSVIADLEGLLDDEDVIVDCGNSHYRDTMRRIIRLRERKLEFLGVGVSGGADGARHGASVMVGGNPQAFDSMHEVFDRMAARANGRTCMAYVGPEGAGHFVKMVHNGIEYGVMQVIAEAWRFLRDSLNLSPTQQAEVFQRFGKGKAASFLIDITAEIVDFKDELTGDNLLDHISDVVGQKGTGRWTLEAALELGVAIPTISAAVSERLTSSARRYPPVTDSALSDVDSEFWIDSLEKSIQATMYLTFLQGIELLESASIENGWQLDLAETIRIWQGGCIIRADMLLDIEESLLSSTLHEQTEKQMADTISPLRLVVGKTIENGSTAAAMAASLAWHDSRSSHHLPTALIAAQRDLFGAHSYKRDDREGMFTTDWSKK